MTASGRFIVTIEEGGTIKLLMVHNAYDRDGLMTSFPRLYSPWRSALESIVPDLPAIAMAFDEDTGGFKVIAVDGQGHFFSVRVNVPNVPERRPFPVLRPQAPQEVHAGSPILHPPFEVHGESSSFSRTKHVYR